MVECCLWDPLSRLEENTLSHQDAKLGLTHRQFDLGRVNLYLLELSLTVISLELPVFIVSKFHSLEKFSISRSRVPKFISHEYSAHVINLDSAIVVEPSNHL